MRRACGAAATVASMVQSLGQVEMVFTLFSRFYLKEQIRRADIAGLCWSFSASRWSWPGSSACVMRCGGRGIRAARCP
jgi:hypothetical protein